MPPTQSPGDDGTISTIRPKSIWSTQVMGRPRPKSMPLAGLCGGSLAAGRRALGRGALGGASLFGGGGLASGLRALQRLQPAAQLVDLGLEPVQVLARRQAAVLDRL